MRIQAASPCWTALDHRRLHQRSSIHRAELPPAQDHQYLDQPQRTSLETAMYASKCADDFTGALPKPTKAIDNRWERAWELEKEEEELTTQLVLACCLSVNTLMVLCIALRIAHSSDVPSSVLGSRQLLRTAQGVSRIPRPVSRQRPLSNAEHSRSRARRPSRP